MSRLETKLTYYPIFNNFLIQNMYVYVCVCAFVWSIDCRYLLEFIFLWNINSDLFHPVNSVLRENIIFFQATCTLQMFVPVNFP